MKDVPHDQHLGRGERVIEEAAALKREAIGQPVLGNIALEHWPNRRKVEPTAA